MKMWNKVPNVKTNKHWHMDGVSAIEHCFQKSHSTHAIMEIKETLKTKKP